MDRRILIDFIEKNSYKCCNIGISQIHIKRNIRNIQDIKECKLCLLYIACEEENLEMCKLLLQKFKYKKFEDLYHVCSLRISCEKGNFEICKLLIENGAKPDEYDSIGNFPFAVVVSCGNIKLCNLFVKNVRNINQKYRGRTLLFIACERGHIEICKLLLENGADVNLISGRGVEQSTALHISIEFKYFEISKLLIEYGANINIKDGCKLTPLELCVKNNYVNDIEFVKFLIEKGANINLPAFHFYEFSYNIINLAYKADSQDLYDFLIKFGYDVNQFDGENKSTILHHASFQKYTKMCNFLIKNGANVNQENLQKRTALHYCCTYPIINIPKSSESNFEIYKLLLENGADINIKTVYESTPISLALESNQFNIYNSLIKHEDEIIEIFFLGHKKDPNCFIYEFNFPWSILKRILYYSGYSYRNYLDRIRTGGGFLCEKEYNLNEQCSIENKKIKIEE